jgi:hypothetical protein
MYSYKSMVVLLTVFFLTNIFVSSMERQSQNPANSIKAKPDVLEIIYTVADRKGLRVISDLAMIGGAWHKTISADEFEEKNREYIRKYYARYGHHESFWGWYLNNEINPIKNTETQKSLFWRKVWKAAVDECHRVHNESKVTVSPFFLLDKEGLRGFEYLEPTEYEEWWTVTLMETGIDVLMLQDSGEHLAFFTLEERKPFFTAFANACRKAGTEFWMNVESAQKSVANWSEAIEMERSGQTVWEFTEIDWLSQKLNLAAKYGEEIVNWGYYPFMTPSENSKFGSDNWFNLSKRKEIYNSYKSYYENVPSCIAPGHKTRPVIKGTLWELPSDYSGWSYEELKKAVEEEIEYQQAIGINLLWLFNTPDNFGKLHVKVDVKDKNTGEVLPGSRVFLGSSMELTDDSGTAFLEMDAGDYNYSVEMDSYITRSGTLTVNSDTTFTFQLTRSLNVKVIVEDDNTKEPLVGSRVTIGSSLEATNEHGEVFFKLSPGDYDYFIQKNSYHNQNGIVTINSDTTFSFHLSRASSFIKFYIKEGLTPVNNAISIVNGDTLVTSNLGLVTYRDLPVGESYDYLIQKRGYSNLSGSIYLEKDTILNLQMEAYPTTLRNLDNINGIKIWPNPARDEINCQIPDDFHFSQFQIIDLNGKVFKIYNIVNENTIRINLIDIPAGLYLMKIISLDKHPLMHLSLSFIKN